MSELTMMRSSHDKIFSGLRRSLKDEYPSLSEQQFDMVFENAFVDAKEEFLGLTFEERTWVIRSYFLWYLRFAMDFLLFELEKNKGL